MAKALVDQFKYTEHERKPIIRSQWCLPQIDLLSTKVKKRLIYIGLPGIAALDIIAWIKFLQKVIAFQCSEYKEGATTKQLDVKLLDNLLESLEREDKLSSSIVYQGWMEDIIMGGLCERGQKYSQEDFLKVYNLDFCNNISTPRTIRSESGKITYHYKLQIIDKLLQYQKTAADADKGAKFIMYLTVNSNVFDGDVSTIKDKPLVEYIKKVNKITRPEVRAVRMMKAYCYNEISTIFNKHNFNVEFLPPIFYFGSDYPNQNRGSHKQFHRMMTFTIVGSKLKAGDSIIKQNCESFLNSKFIFATDNKIQCYTDKYINGHIEEIDYDPNPSTLLSQSHIYKNLW